MKIVLLRYFSDVLIQFFFSDVGDRVKQEPLGDLISLTQEPLLNTELSPFTHTVLS